MSEAADRPTAAIRIGRFRLTGAAAAIVLIALIAALIAIFRPAFRWSPLWISAALWIALSVYWSAAAAKAAPTARSESAGSRQFHELLINAGLLLLFLRIPGLKARWLPDAAWVAALGLAIQIGSVALMIRARRHLGPNWSGAITQKVGHELVRSGPYRALRHPIYTGMLGMYAGTAAVSGEIHALIGLSLVIIAYARKIPLEERNLRDLFGAAYDEYRKQSWSLIPGLY